MEKQNLDIEDFIKELKIKWYTQPYVKEWWENEMRKAYHLGELKYKQEVLKFIEKERDNGNIEMEVNCKEGQKGFSAGLCLSKLLKELGEK